MQTWKAKVVNGRLVLLDEATALPEGTELELIPASMLDPSPLTREEEDGLIAALAAVKRGETVSAQDVQAHLTRKM